MTWLNYRDGSRRNYATEKAALTFEQIQTGCLQRIADATEKMAQWHTELINSRDYYKELYQRTSERLIMSGRSNRSLRGQITKLKKRLAAKGGAQ